MRESCASFNGVGNGGALVALTFVLTESTGMERGFAEAMSPAIE